MPVYLRKRDIPELRGLEPSRADARLRTVQHQLGLKPALLGSLVFGGLTLAGIGIGALFGEPLAGTLAGWMLGLWAYVTVRLNASRPLLRAQTWADDA